MCPADVCLPGDTAARAQRPEAAPGKPESEGRMQRNRKRHLPRVWTLAGAVAAGLALNASSAGGQAQTSTSNERLRFTNQPVVVTRPGAPPQTFTVNGGVHVLLHSTLDASGGCHLKGHFNPQGLSVRGPGGEMFHAAGAGNFTMQSTSGQDGTRFHGVLNLNLIGKGRAPDVKMHINTKTPPVQLPAGCDARTVGDLIVESLGISFPDAPNP
jgi:hypothetical protein